jgi:predicted ATPase
LRISPQSDRSAPDIEVARSNQWLETPGSRGRGVEQAPPHGLIGRAEELAAMGGLLDEHRLVTVTGPGGVGKTRLAFALADAWRSGGTVTVVDLTDVAESARVAPAVAAAFGAREGSTLEQALIAAGEEAARFVVVDRCEHVAEGAAAAVATLLRCCAGARVVATSREPLRLLGERVFALQPLATPAAEAGLGARDALSYRRGALPVMGAGGIRRGRAERR